MDLKRLLVLTLLFVSVGAAFVGTLLNGGKLSLKSQVLALPATVVDDGDAGFSLSGEGWKPIANSVGYRADFTYRSSLPDSSVSARWTFADVQPGSYRVFVTYKAYSLLSNQVPYTIMDGGAVVGSTTVNQRAEPMDNTYDGRNWSLLGEFPVQEGTLTVALMPQGDAGAMQAPVMTVIADAMRIERVELPACNAPDCSAAPVGCRYVDPVEDDNRCLTSCGILECSVCGNGVCEEGEATSCPSCATEDPPCGEPCQAGICPEDCPASAACPQLAPPPCENGILLPQIAPDENGCPLPPVCCADAYTSQQCAASLLCVNGSCRFASCSCL